MVMDVLGPTLENLMKYCHRRFTVKTVCMVADQLLTRIEVLHNTGFIHRDIKPDNFLIGVGKKQMTIFMIDFGLSKRFINPITD